MGCAVGWALDRGADEFAVEVWTAGEVELVLEASVDGVSDGTALDAGAVLDASGELLATAFDVLLWGSIRGMFRFSFWDT